MMSVSVWGAVSRYGFAVMTTAAALLLLSVPAVRMGPGGGVLWLLLSVFAASWRAGRGPGLFATALLAAALVGSGEPAWRGHGLLLFLANSAAVSVAAGAVREAGRRAEAAGAEGRIQEERYRRIVETADEGIWLLDAEGRATFVNARGAAMLGLNPAAAVGRPLLGFAEGVGGDQTGVAASADVGAAAARAMAELHAGRPARFDLRLRREDGRTLWARVSASPLTEAGAFAGTLAMLSDVTDRVASAEALRRSEARFRRLSESGMIGVAVMDLDGLVLDANDEYLRILGGDRADLAAGRVNCLERTAPEYRERDRRKVEELRRLGVSTPFEKVYVRQDGSRVAVLVGAASIEGPEEDATGHCIGFVLDISARRRAEESLRLLADAGAVISAPIGRAQLDEPLRGLARLAVPRLADFCVVDAVEPDGSLRRAAASLAQVGNGVTEDPAVPPPPPGPPDPKTPLGSVLRTAQPALLEGPVSPIPGFPGGDLSSAMIVPLVAHGRTIAAATLGVRDGKRRFDLEDLALAGELARRAALPLENARLYREAREALRHRDEVHALTDALLEAAPVGVAFFDPGLRYVRVNRVLARLNGLPVEAHLGRRFAEVVPQTAATFEPVLRGVLETGEPVLNREVEGAPRESAGPMCWLVNFYPARGPSGEVIGVGVTLSDVTESKRVARELREAKEAAEAARARADVILASITDGFFTVDHQWRLTYVNPRAEALLRRSAAGLLGRSLWEEFPEAEGTAFDLRRYPPQEPGRAIEFEAYYPPLGAWFEVHAYPSEDGFSVYFRETTERRRGEEALRASERQFRTLAEAIPQMVWVARADGSLEYLNRRWSEYTGLAPEDLAARGWRQAVHPDDVASSAAWWASAVARGEAEENLERLRRGTDGAYRWHLTRAEPVRGDDGRVLAWFGTSTDIDDRRRAEEGLRFLAEASAVLGASLDYHTALAEVARLAVPGLADWCVIDVAGPDGALRRVAAAHADPETQRMSEPFRARYQPGGALYGGITEVVRAGRPVLISDLAERTRARPSGTRDHSEAVERLALRSLICVPLPSRGRVLGAITLIATEGSRRFGAADLALAEDLAARAAQAIDNALLFAEAEAARLEAEAASAAKDRFLAALSHELRTPLTPVLVGVTAMLEDPDLPASVRPVLDVTRRNVALEARLIDDLLDVTRIAQGKLRLHRELVDAHDLILQAVEICRDETAVVSTRLVLELNASARHVQCDPARIQQILWNLVKNAIKFTPPGGEVRVRSFNRPEAGFPPTLVVEVVDTGVGIEPEILPRIFNAFDQGDASVTRQFGGLGLGLAISRSLAEAHGGRLQAASPGRNLGATFTLELPVAAASQSPPDRAEAPTPTPDPSGEGARPDDDALRILLTEDNTDTLRVMARLLRHRGHHVTTAEGVEAALAAAAEEGPFDLVISDIGLPDGSGLELIRRLREGQSLPAIALSGYGTDDDLRKSKDAGFLTHLTKPVDFSTLEAAIRKAVADHRFQG